MQTYSGIAEATRDVRTKVNESETANHLLSSPTLAVVVPSWTESLSGFQANVTVAPDEAVQLQQISALYDYCEEWLTETAQQLKIGQLNEHDPTRVLFMGLFRDLQIRFAEKQNLNPHKLAVLLSERYTVTE